MTVIKVLVTVVGEMRKELLQIVRRPCRSSASWRGRSW